MQKPLSRPSNAFILAKPGFVNQTRGICRRTHWTAHILSLTRELECTCAAIYWLVLPRDAAAKGEPL